MKVPRLELLSPPRLARLAVALGLAVSFAGAGRLLVKAIAAPVAHSPQTPTGQSPGPTTAGTNISPGAARNSTTQTEPYRPQPLARVQQGYTEFQQLVENSTGQQVPIFGASLFSTVPSTFAPVPDVPVDANYVLGPGDEIGVQLVGQVNLQYDLTIDRTGAIIVPQLGVVHVAGVPYGKLNAYLTNQFSRLYRGFTLNATLGSLRSIQVFVVGEAVRPGSYNISSMSTLLNAVFASGGPLADGSLRNIQVKRDGKTLVHFDLYDLLLRGDKSNDIRLISGDVIFIPFAGPQVAIAGSVNTPAIYEMKGPTTVTEALQLAGGETPAAGGRSVRVERVDNHSMRSVQDVDLASGGSQLLENGDILSVSSIVERFRNAVTLRGNVANPGRYVWHAGMRLSELFPDKAALITRNYWRKQNQLGLLSEDYLPNPGATTNGNGQNDYGSGNANRQQPANGPGSQPGANQGQQQGQLQQGQLQQGQLQTAPEAQNQNRANSGVSAQNGRSAGTALTTSSSTNFTAQTSVILTAPDIDWSYAVIERLNASDLKTSLVPFNLGKLVLDGDPSQNLELQPNDIVTVFSTADIRVPSLQQTRYVRLEGEFAAPGVYSVLPGETLRSLVQRAGGFTPQAYLYASEFTRESTRKLEAQRLQEYANQLDAQISSVTASSIARAVTPTDQVAASASAEDARSAVARLRTLTPIGRLVLDVQPDSVGVNALPDLALEDGDRFLVPRIPSSITVEGEVYNANAFVYVPHSRMADYLRKAGGPDRQADKKREFILRADGSVVSDQYAKVQRSAVYPGDTLVVPPILDRRALFQRVIDLASVISNFGYSATTLYLISRP